MEVYMDGGVRQGTDVLKALAMGARAVFIGRPVLWGLAYNGQEGVERVLQILRDEFKTAMMLSGTVKHCSLANTIALHSCIGCRNLAEIQPSLVVHQSKISTEVIL